jgi:hypothetical protein
MPLILFSLLAGIILGQWFKVAILIPGMAVYLLIAIGLATAHAETLSWTALTSVAGGCALQIGYLAGTAFRVSRRKESAPNARASGHPASRNAR